MTKFQAIIAELLCQKQCCLHEEFLGDFIFYRHISATSVFFVKKKSCHWEKCQWEYLLVVIQINMFREF